MINIPANSPLKKTPTVKPTDLSADSSTGDGSTADEGGSKKQEA